MLNTIKDKLGFNKNKVKVTLYTQNGKELDLRSPIHGNKIEIRKFGKSGTIELNPEIESNPLYDKGQRYIVFEGIDRTIYPPQIVEKGIGELTKEQKISNSDSFDRGRRYEHQLIESKEKDLIKYIAYGIVALAGLLILVNIFMLGQFDAQNETLTTLGDSVTAIKGLVGNE